MMRPRPFYWITLMAMAWCVSCYSAAGPTAYYTLQSVAMDEGIGLQRPATRLVIGIGPLVLPEYLNRQPLVTRISPNRVRVNEGHRWAGSLQSEIQRVLADDLLLQTKAAQVVVFPWGQHVEPDLQFRIKILAFEGQIDGRVQLKAAWTLTPADSNQPAVQRVTNLEENSATPGLEDVAAAMGRVLGRLSREMAEAVYKANSINP